MICYDLKFFITVAAKEFRIKHLIAGNYLENKRNNKQYQSPEHGRRNKRCLKRAYHSLQCMRYKHTYQ